MGDRERASLGDAGSVAHHIAALGDADEDVRATAAYELAHSGSAQAVEALIPLLRDPAVAVRANAAYALYHLEARSAAEAVLPLLADPDPRVRMEAALAMGRFAYPPALAPLLTLLADDDAHVQEFVSQYGFGMLGEVALPSLLRAVTHPRNTLRAGAAKALGTLVSLDAVWSVPEPVRRDRYPYALSASSKTRAVDALLIAATDEDSDVRLCALDGLGRHGDPRAIPVLLEALTDADPSIRAWAVEGLHQCGASEAVPVLARLLVEDQSLAVRRHAVVALRDLAVADDQVLSALHVANEFDSDAGVRSDAARALAHLQRGQQR
jgi:HEAT repeat protein